MARHGPGAQPRAPSAPSTQLSWVAAYHLRSIAYCLLFVFREPSFYSWLLRVFGKHGLSSLQTRGNGKTQPSNCFPC